MQTVYTVGPDDKVEVRPVTTGDRVGNSWIIEQGLQPGDRVIVEGQLKVRPGMQGPAAAVSRAGDPRRRRARRGTEPWRDSSSIIPCSRW